MEKSTYQQEMGFPDFGPERGFPMGLKIKSTLVCHRHIHSWITYEAFGFPLAAILEIVLAF
jgi:hypothetical protein